jgi:hypothetical protein
VVCPDDSAIDHLHGIAAAALGKGFEHQVPQSAGRPAAILPVHRIPVAELVGQIAPGRAGPSDPEHSVQRATVVNRRTPPQGATLDHERFEKRPLIVA